MRNKHTKRNAQRYEDHRYENVKTYIMPSPQHFAALVYGRSSGSGIDAISAFPYISYSDIIDIAPPLQRRDRAGFAPASLLPQCYLSTSKHLFDLEWMRLLQHRNEGNVKSRGNFFKDICQMESNVWSSCMYQHFVIAYYICKWLDSEEQTAQHSENPGAGTPGFSFLI